VWVRIIMTVFHLMFAALLGSFHPCCLSNVKQEQINARERCKRQVKRILYVYS